MSDWDPVILGVSANDLEKELKKRLTIAVKAGVPEAHRAKIQVKGNHGVAVTISGLDRDEAKEFWDKHLVKAVTALGGTVKGS